MSSSQLPQWHSLRNQLATKEPAAAVIKEEFEQQKAKLFAKRLPSFYLIPRPLPRGGREMEFLLFEILLSMAETVTPLELQLAPFFLSAWYLFLYQLYVQGPPASALDQILLSSASLFYSTYYLTVYGHGGKDGVKAGKREGRLSFLLVTPSCAAWAWDNQV